jgi:hypothetical protein
MLVSGERVEAFFGANSINGFMGRVIDTAIQARFCNKPVTVVF